MTNRDVHSAPISVESQGTSRPGKPWSILYHVTEF